MATTTLPPALADRDLGFVHDWLPVIRAVVDRLFRPDIAGLDAVPDGPVLLVGNHSGGTVPVDAMAFVLAFIERFGTARPLYWLGHPVVTSAPLVGSFLRRCGVVPAGPDVARQALDAGAAVAVYPGGEVELHRPWTARNEIRFLGRKGWLRLAADTGVPVVAVVSQGAHNTYLNLTDGQGVARALRLDRLLRLKTFPISLALPWGLNVGDFLLHLPAPAKLRIAVLDPVDVPERWGDDLDAAYDAIVGDMQATLDRLAAGTPAHEARP